MRFLVLIVWLIWFAGNIYAQTAPDAPYARHRMAAAIEHYQNMQRTGNWHTFPEDLLLRPGDTSQHVPALQENLILTGDLPLDSATTDSIYTESLQRALRKFQRRHGLQTDAILGPNTASELNVPLAQRLWQLQHNFALWDSTFFTTQQPYLVINLPDYTLQLVDSGKTVLHMKVIVGKPELKTYPLVSEVNMLVLRPYWYVPKSISVNEIVPLLRRNPGYLHKKQMQLEQPGKRGWVRLSPWRVNWHEVTASNFNYRIVQLAGPENELGQVKFLFPNTLPQYMHDTPNKHLFAYPGRAFSHGCIRLEKPFELADFILLRGAGYSPAKIKALWRARKPNHYLAIKNPLPLYIVYFTAWVDEQLQVHFRDDVYGLHQRQATAGE